MRYKAQERRGRRRKFCRNFSRYTPLFRKLFGARHLVIPMIDRRQLLDITYKNTNLPIHRHSQYESLRPIKKRSKNGRLSFDRRFPPRGFLTNVTSRSTRDCSDDTGRVTESTDTILYVFPHCEYGSLSSCSRIDTAPGSIYSPASDLPSMSTQTLLARN